MALGSTLSLSKDQPTPVATNLAVYALRAADLNKSIFSVAGSISPAEKRLTVSHETGKGGEERHLVRLDRTELDANLVPATLSTYIVIVRPASTAISPAIVTEEINRLADFFVQSSNANVTKLLNQEV